MNFNQDILKELVDKLALNCDISISDLPNMQLYMEQMLSFFDGKLDPVRHNEKPLTSMMINNYTKKGILPQPVKKKYSNYHMILIILVAQLKHLLSIEDIKKLFTPILKDINNTGDDLIKVEEIYSTFIELKRDQFDDSIKHYVDQLDLIKNKVKDIPDIDNKKQAELFLLVMMLVAQANASKQLAEKIIDDYFS